MARVHRHVPCYNPGVTYVADLHIHSPYSLATSPELSLENLARWAKAKGIDLLATGDFTHPGWLREIREKLSDAGDGLFELEGMKFVLGTEVNCNAPQEGRHRRIHMLAYAPGLETVERINLALARRSKSLESDGRPTIHMTPRELVSTLLEIDDRCIAIPAHVWTPWFGVYGAKSGFDSLEQCFGDMLPHITAIETGLSSDPAMCWGVPELDDLSIVSFSDAHSPAKLGRELTVFNGQPSYGGLVRALKTQDIAWTVEFFPEEGKYHHSGHRKCGVSYSPAQIAGHGEACPTCGRPVTMGVSQRVAGVGSRQVVARRGDDGLIRGDNARPPFRSLVSLQQVVAEALGQGVNTKRVRTAYAHLLEAVGTETDVLIYVPVTEIAEALPQIGQRVAEGVSRVRTGDVHVEPGFDGQFGRVRVWAEGAA